MIKTSPTRRPEHCNAAAALAVVALLAGCAAPPLMTSGGVPIDTRYNSKGQDSRVMFLVIHYTVGNFESSLKTLTEGEVSSHYLLTDHNPPRIYRLVDETRRAWHSGPSHWRGHGPLNASSIGIEIVHPGFIETPQGRVYQPYPPDQIDALIPLIRDIVKRHQIRPERIVGHSDVLPQYKQDPGPTFPWKRLADEGLVPWPDAARVAAQRSAFELNAPAIAWFQKALQSHGFALPQSGVFDDATRDALAAFQMRFRPEKFDGTPDAQTAALLHVLTMP